MQGQIKVFTHRFQPALPGSVNLGDRLNQLRLDGYTIISVYPSRNNGLTSHGHEIVASEPVSMKDHNTIKRAQKGFHNQEFVG